MIHLSQEEEPRVGVRDEQVKEHGEAGRREEHALGVKRTAELRRRRRPAPSTSSQSRRARVSGAGRAPSFHAYGSGSGIRQVWRSASEENDRRGRGNAVVAAAGEAMWWLGRWVQFVKDRARTEIGNSFRLYLVGHRGKKGNG
jgi:hypothetical protein